MRKAFYPRADYRFYHIGRGIVPIKELFRRSGFSNASLYTRGAKFGGMIA
ncbi:hypothetical protein GCM10009425_45460 [Pseudomonas asuensis]|uniref:Uncharacterized protein n=1 Tax=Pseudomonas asuensis TaxID=1825787 RepID=A0ABQ2H499_9PSED|nr:hypothetical protein GCM10009425_45460 [Pseudomonas asuensis]